MKMKWRNLPAIVTLLAGFITCVITTLCRYPLNKMLWVLIAVMTVFFTIGLIIRAVIMHFVEGRDADEFQFITKRRISHDKTSNR